MILYPKRHQKYNRSKAKLLNLLNKDVTFNFGKYLTHTDINRFLKNFVFPLTLSYIFRFCYALLVPIRKGMDTVPGTTLIQRTLVPSPTRDQRHPKMLTKKFTTRGSNFMVIICYIFMFQVLVRSFK